MKSSSSIMADGALAFLGLFSNTSSADLFLCKIVKINFSGSYKRI